MSVIRVGSTHKYADGWDLVFGGSRGRKSAAKKPRPTTAKQAKARPAKKKAKAKPVAKRSKSGKKAGRRKG